MNKPAPMSDEQLDMLCPQSNKNKPAVWMTKADWDESAQAIIAARDAQWEAMLAAPQDLAAGPEDMKVYKAISDNYFAKAPRQQEFKTIMTTPQQEPIPDCGEAGHAEGCCGNAQCLPSYRKVLK
jgi:hypothetical protein